MDSHLPSNNRLRFPLSWFGPTDGSNRCRRCFLFVRLDSRDSGCLVISLLGLCLDSSACDLDCGKRFFGREGD
ncbi:hypothetical protein U1Q18_002357 [Sarracenia purpurea var. burkii]